MSEELIRVEQLGKKFCRTLRRSLWYGVLDILRELTGSRRSRWALRKGEFWALEDVDFTLKRGELVGVIGPNGSGKTTLLKILSGLLKPDRGAVTINGKIQALIALGAGFNPILTARENVYVNGAILGISRKEMDVILEDIRDFSELGDFFEMPVQSYSSGMQVRLGFAIAVHLKPDILIVDEVLAVGDASFRRKARNKMMELLHSGISVLFVSHNMTLISSLTSKCLYLSGGRVAGWGDSAEMTTRYVKDSIEKAGMPVNRNGLALHPMSLAYLSFPEILIVKKAETRNVSGGVSLEFKTHDDICIRLECEFKKKLKDVQVGIAIRDRIDDAVITSGKKILDHTVPDGTMVILCRINRLPLREGNFNIGLYISDLHGGGLFKSHQVSGFSIVPDEIILARSDRNHGCLVADVSWSIEHE